MKARIRDTELFFDVEGSVFETGDLSDTEKPIAFIIHGGPGGDHSSFRKPFSPLARRIQLVYFDHRGQGRSARGDPAKYTLDENVEDMEGLRRHLGAGRIVSIGTSYGGLVAMAHAARYPEAVSALILIATFSHSGHRQRAMEILQERGTAEQQAMGAALWAGNLVTVEQCDTFFRVMGPLYSVRHEPTKGGRSYPFSPEPLNRAFGPTGFLRDFNLRPELSRIKAPALVLAGRHDWICAPEFSDEIHDLIAGSKLVVLEQSGHSIRIDQPEEMIKEIRVFIDSIFKVIKFS
jgi:proline iminopeptidase